MQPETELVIALSRTPLSGAARSRINRLLSPTIAWEAIVNLASRWQVQPTVFGNLRDGFSAAMPPEILDKFVAEERNARAFALVRTLQLANLVQKFRAAGIPVIVLKGPAVSIAAYDDYSRRTFADVDLLVRRSDLLKARDFLLTTGFTPTFSAAMETTLIADQHALEFADEHTKVELHWSLLSRHLRFDIDPEQLWAEAESVDCMGSEISVLAPEHLFLYLCAHGAKHEWMLFRWILDVAQLARRLDSAQAERVVALAAATHSRRILALGLRIARDTFGEEDTPFPPSALMSDRDTRLLAALVWARLDPGVAGTRELLPFAIAGLHPYVGPLAFWMRSRERMRDQLACAARFLFIPAASDADRGAMHRVLRPARLVANAFKRIVHPS